MNDVDRIRRSAQSWSPKVGDATSALGKHLLEKDELPNQETFDAIVDESLVVIGQCRPFAGDDGRRTGLVVGHVQSGKTISMTTVASLARDNGCKLVILLAGVTDNLLRQTARDRIQPYLLDKPDPPRGWRFHDSVESSRMDGLATDLRSWAPQWRSESFPERRKKPIFVTIMKNHAHLSKLAEQLASIDLRGIPALILDDEADQASLNTKARSKEDPSTTYRCIEALRSALPHHTYLQYTATPQAPVLISLTDMLSPEFSKVLTPGQGYTGGEAFFGAPNGLIHDIPEEDRFPANSPPDEPPESLLQALRIFLVGVGIGMLQGGRGKRSMLVHPSSRRADHDAYVGFVDKAKAQWEAELRLGEDDTCFRACVEDFRSAYLELCGTSGDLPPFEEVLEELRYDLPDVSIHKVNSDDGREVAWHNGYAHILVGGDKLNRGFTVQGLTVTYMPRSPGSWTADTIQQRARFFGYKGSYLELCRVYLHPEIREAYEEYVHHERDIRAQLISFHGRPLREWKRSFVLGHRQNPTRSNVLTESIHKPKHSDWFRQSMPHVDVAMVERNRGVRESILDMLGDALQPDEQFPQHSYATVGLSDLFEGALLDYQCFGPDAVDWTAVLLWLAELLHKAPEAQCTVYSMQHGAGRKRTEEEGRRVVLFQGRSSSSEEGKYPGDDKIRNDAHVTLQIHSLSVKCEGGPVEDVTGLALRLPKGFVPTDVVLQPKRGQA